MTTIENSYLIWIGSEHYDTIEAYCEEAAKLGVSKRLPNVAMGKALMAPDTAIFIAHDEGEMHECEGCCGTIECGTCRKYRAAFNKETGIAAALLAESKTLAVDSKERASAVRRSANASARASKLETDMAECGDCQGTNTVHDVGTGGSVTFEDGAVWDFRQYNYWLHQPTKWTPEDQGGFAEINRCEECGGTGRIPDGKVFGMFFPDRIEFIEGGKPKVATDSAAAGFTPVTELAAKGEKKRGCGKRAPGGVYAVTDPKGVDAKVAEVSEALSIDTDQIEVHGSFIRFMEPYGIEAKRFRGLARTTPDELGIGVVEEAEMILEASA